ncbi:MAG TPA: glycine zipper 2TM domain-containing protein, partial [Burkholderiales bacterium]|nr:glycine zipper 2TM domain-containing protein [Burkholderiales bacterium]
DAMDVIHDHGWRRQGLLYPLMLIAAIAVIVFSILGIATMTGLLPSALSGYRPETEPSHATKAPQPSAQAERDRLAREAAAAACPECGVVASIHAMEAPGQDNVLGAVAGGVVGGLLGNEIGGGNGRTATTVLGAGAGAYAGSEIQKNMNRRTTYQIRVHMSDGRQRTFYQSAAPALTIGQRVRLVKGRLIAAD